ncbi:GNAT family N-acetyltransferase [Pontibacillus yanchengensis]|uniref:Aminoglycoside 6'-acetyltransferase n=1 Tax=Pontibacillus yanchengensis Y32 TaxID=1385514 RepID=A0A0A2TC50_9BACI|nr:GNAT family protein [Pontibacillus yanchengensis]KGP72003.1 aminoglycoside 6'-acetyltransferase [Pontibacillus yanchengensis Y32]
MLENNIKFLEGNRVYLRPIEEEDLDLFYKKALWDKEGRKLTGTQAVFSRKGVQTWYERISTDDSRIDLIICLQGTDQPIGELAMLDIDHQNRKSVVRISIFDHAYWGNGYGTEALSLLIAFGFDILNLNRIGLDVFAFNTRGIKAYEKLGFKEEGRIKEDLYYNGEYHDSILMGLMRKDYYQREN